MSYTNLLRLESHRDSRIFGVLVGVVSDNVDPDEIGRVKVKFPRISGDEESTWARQAMPMAGAEMGTFFLPEVGDEVLVAFEYGDITMPYVIGSLWNGVEKPAHTNADEENNIREIKSRSGHIIRFDDTDGGEKIEVIDKNGTNTIVIDSVEDTITVTSAKDIVVAAPDGKITLTSKEMLLETSDVMEFVSGADLNGTAAGDMNLVGANINLN